MNGTRWILILALTALPAAAEIRTDNVIATRGGGTELIIPAAGAIVGANGTFFRSEINLLNYTNRAQRVKLRWMTQGGVGQKVPTDLTLQPFTGISSEDFVTDILHQTGLGAILVTGVTADGLNTDLNARLYASDRIWSRQPGTAGTVSQSFQVVQTNELNSGRSSSLIGLRRDEQFRLNVGIVNLSTTDQVFQIVAGGSTPTLAAETITVSIPALSMKQVNVPGAPQQNLQVVITNVNPQGTQSTRWLAYGSSVDNITGDSWSEIAFVPETDITVGAP